MASTFSRRNKENSRSAPVLSQKRAERPHHGWVPGHDPDPFQSIAQARFHAVAFISQVLGIRFSYPLSKVDLKGKGEKSLSISDILPEGSDQRKFEEVSIKPIFSDQENLIGHHIVLRTPESHGGKKMCIEIRIDENPCGPAELEHKVTQSWDVRVSASGRYLRKATTSQHFVVCGSDTVR